MCSHLTRVGVVLPTPGSTVCHVIHRDHVTPRGVSLTAALGSQLILYLPSAKLTLATTYCADCIYVDSHLLMVSMVAASIVHTLTW